LDFPNYNTSEACGKPIAVNSLQLQKLKITQVSTITTKTFYQFLLRTWLRTN